MVGSLKGLLQERLEIALESQSQTDNQSPSSLFFNQNLSENTSTKARILPSSLSQFIFEYIMGNTLYAWGSSQLCLQLFSSQAAVCRILEGIC